MLLPGAPLTPEAVRTSFLGLSIQRGTDGVPPTAASALGDEPLAFYTKNCRGVYGMDWPCEDFPGTAKVMKWKFTSKAPKFPEPEEAAKLAPSVDAVDFQRLQHPTHGPGELQATWVGHASFLVQVGHVNILTDPVFSERCAPMQWAGPKRYVPPPLELDQLPRIDVVTISHNHYDHLDHGTVVKLRELFQPTFVVPLGMKSWFEGLGWKPTDAEKEAGVTDPVHTKVIELDWWEASWVRPAAHDAAMRHLSPILITFVPVQHWSMRTGPWDRCKELWGGFVYEMDVVEHHVEHPHDEARPSHAPDAETPKKVSKKHPPNHLHSGDATTARSRVIRRFFHCGDTGYSDVVFKQIGEIFRHFDLAMIPIGAYEPRWFMHVQHVDPEEAVQIHLDLKRPTLSLGMHWGTFILTDEPLDEPPKLLAECATGKGLREGEFIALKHGETVSATAAPMPSTSYDSR